MKKIILASASKQRQSLLGRLGIPFTIKLSKVREIKRIRTTCAALVKGNALLKARDVARRTKNGVVIGADTLVYLGNRRIIGKPRNLSDAKRILKRLFAAPHWV